MKPNKTALTALAAAFTLLGACGGGSSSGGSTPTGSDNTPQVPTTYSFDSQITEGESAVSYTGQNARQILIEDLVATILDLTDNPLRSQAEVEAELEFYISGDVDNTNYKYALEGETVIPGPTYGDVSTGKNLADKIAGGNSTGGGEFGKLINDEFFGWAELGANDRPIHLVTRYIENIAELATNGTAPTITVNGVPTQVDTVYVDEKGRDFRQLIQKFLRIILPQVVIMTACTHAPMKECFVSIFEIIDAIKEIRDAVKCQKRRKPRCSKTVYYHALVQ
ncbi:MAG: hypothetical protein ACPHN3_11095 [Spongiibacter sp.]